MTGCAGHDGSVSRTSAPPVLAWVELPNPELILETLGLVLYKGGLDRGQQNSWGLLEGWPQHHRPWIDSLGCAIYKPHHFLSLGLSFLKLSNGLGEIGDPNLGGILICS